jgi:hypothetical protein
MKISGFTMVRNATKLYYPIREAIESILPICDEFVVALGNCDPDDATEQEILRIGSDKVRILRTTWDLERFPRGAVHAQQTDLAMQACTGDWLFYLQSDEVVHERYLPVIQRRCEELLDDPEVEGLLFRYKHFWGDYNHYVLSHEMYPNEVRIVRRDPEIHSWWTAQGFRRIPDFDGVSYRTREGTAKLKVAQVDAEIFHYGFVRPPRLMQRKNKAFQTIHRGAAAAEQQFLDRPDVFDYGNLGRLAEYRDPAPAVMRDRIARMDWQDELRYSDAGGRRTRHRHERLKYRLLTFIEQRFLGGKTLFGYRNYILLKDR